MKSHLKVKVFSLSQEMTYIRRQEEKWKDKARNARKKQAAFSKTVGSHSDRINEAINYCEANFWSQRGHRDKLKIEARTTHLAYGCMRGVPYFKMENTCYGQLKGMGGYEPYWNNIMTIVERFSKDEPNAQEIMQKAEEWLHEAKIWYEGNEDRIKQMDAFKAAVRETAMYKEGQKQRLEQSNTIKRSKGIAV